MEGAEAQVATFLPSISLRAHRAWKLHTQFLQKIRISAVQLIGLSMKREILKQSRRPSKWRRWCTALRMPPFTPANIRNACYANTIVHAVWAAATCTSRNISYTSVSGASPVRVRHSLDFSSWHAWPCAQQQQDVAEFVNFLLPRAVVHLPTDLWE